MGLRAMSDRTPGQITRPRQAPKILTAPWSPWSSIFSVLKPCLLPVARTPGRLTCATPKMCACDRARPEDLRQRAPCRMIKDFGCDRSSGHVWTAPWMQEKNREI
jgi:hypothetical protein